VILQSEEDVDVQDLPQPSLRHVYGSWLFREANIYLFFYNHFRAVIARNAALIDVRAHYGSLVCELVQPHLLIKRWWQQACWGGKI